MRLPCEKLRSAPSAQRKVSGCSVRRGTRGASSRVPEDKGTPPAPRTPVQNLVRPPLFVPTIRSSPARLRRGGRGALGQEKPPDRAAPARPRAPGPLEAPVWGGGSCSDSFQLDPLGAAAKTRRLDLAHWRRQGLLAEQGQANSRRCRFFQSRGRRFLSRGVAKRDLPKAGASGWRPPPDERRGASGAVAGPGA